MRDVEEPEETLEADNSAADRPSPTLRIAVQQAAIAQIGQSALGQKPALDLFHEACQVIARILGAEMVDILELAPDQRTLRVVAGVGWRPGIVGNFTVSGGSGSMSGYTIARGGPVTVTDLATESRFQIQPILLELGAKSAISVRIGEADAPYGAVNAFTTRRVQFTRDDTHFLQAVANILAAAIERTRVEHELRDSRDQLAAIVASIDEGITITDHTGVVYANDMAAQMAGLERAGDLLGGTDQLSRFEILDEHGNPMPADEVPSRRALHGEDHAQAILHFRRRDTGEARWSLLRSTPIRSPAGEVMQVINVFRDVTREHWADEAAAFMADAAVALSSTLDTHEAARRLAHLAVPRLADYCTVQLLKPDGSAVTAALVHSNPERVAVAQRVLELRPFDINSDTAAARAIREGRPALGELTDEMIEAAPMTDEERELAHGLEIHSYVVVPLVGRRRPIGALSLVMSESGRRLSDQEFQLAMQLGERAGLALENAQAFRAADDRRAQLAAVLGALDEAVFVFSRTGELRLRNRAADDLLAGSPAPTLAALAAVLGLDGAQIAAAADEPLEFALAVPRKWLELHVHTVTAEAEEEGAESFAPTVIVLRDMTAQRAARAARDAFLGVLSHELRTPITTIYGGSELLERELGAEHRAEVIADIRVESERLARLVEDLLVMTRVEQGMVAVDVEPILVQRLLPTVIRAFQSRWPGVEVRTSLDNHLPAVAGDATYVEQVMRNLLTNAVRYGAAREHGIDVVAGRENGQLVVRVLDRGPGFGDDDAQHLFDLFYRAPAARLVPGGAGIGLYVCRQLVESMDGQMWAAPRDDGSGAEFGFSLPVMDVD